MVQRSEFELWDSKRQRKYAKRMYLVVRKSLLDERRENGIYRDRTGGLETEVHHCWERSHCPLWWTFQRENMLPISPQAHYAIHNFSKDQYTPEVKYIADMAEQIKQEIIKSET